MKPLLEEEAQQQRWLAGLKRGDALPVVQNSAPREKPEENAKSAHEAAEMMRLPVTSVRPPTRSRSTASRPWQRQR